MGTCIIFLEGSASEGQNIVYRWHTLKGPVAQRKGHFFNGHSVTLNHDLLFLSVCISTWQRQRENTGICSSRTTTLAPWWFADQPMFSSVDFGAFSTSVNGCLAETPLSDSPLPQDIIPHPLASLSYFIHMHFFGDYLTHTLTVFPSLG